MAHMWQITGRPEGRDREVQSPGQWWLLSPANGALKRAAAGIAMGSWGVIGGSMAGLTLGAVGAVEPARDPPLRRLGAMDHLRHLLRWAA